MSIEITDDYEYHLNRMNKAFQNIQGGTYLKELTTQDKYHYAGVRKPPTFTDNGDGSVTIGDDGEYALYSDNSGSSLLEVFYFTRMFLYFTNSFLILGKLVQ